MKGCILIFGLIIFNFLFCEVSFGQKRVVLERMKPIGIRSEYALKPNKNKIITVHRPAYSKGTDCRKVSFCSSTNGKTYQREEINRMACF